MSGGLGPGLPDAFFFTSGIPNASIRAIQNQLFLSGPKSAEESFRKPMSP